MKSGFVAVIGKPNAGKSSLVNKLVGFEVAIIAPKPQTTRFNIKGIRTTKTSQIIFIDTPGVHTPKNKLGEFMIKGVINAISNVDMVLYLVDGSKPVIDEANKNIMNQIVNTNKKIILAINKVDKIKKENILRIIDEYNKYIKSLDSKFEEIIPISVYSNEGIDDLINCIEKILPEGNLIFEEDEITDITERELVEEFIRAKALKYLDEEIPHGLIIQVEKMKDRVTENGNTVYDIDANIICKKDSHKGIIIGKNGEMLKRIGTAARHDIEKLLDARVNLKLWVKVRKDWDDNDSFLNTFKDKIR